MINLQDFEQLEPTQAIEIDLAVLDLQNKLRTNLPWASHVYGRSYKTTKQTDATRLVVPEVYIGNTDGKFSLAPATPDNDKKAVMFFVIEPEKFIKWESNTTNFLNYNVGIVVWVNLELIDEPLAKNEDFTQTLIKQMRNVLTNELVGERYRVELFEVTREKNQVWKEFTLIDEKYTKMPYAAFRFNMSISLREFCGLPPDREASLLANISGNEIINILLPKVSFTPEVIAALTDEQKTQLNIEL